MNGDSILLVEDDKEIRQGVEGVSERSSGGTLSLRLPFPGGAHSAGRSSAHHEQGRRRPDLSGDLYPALHLGGL